MEDRCQEGVGLSLLEAWKGASHALSVCTWDIMKTGLLIGWAGLWGCLALPVLRRLFWRGVQGTTQQLSSSAPSLPPPCQSCPARLPPPSLGRRFSRLPRVKGKMEGHHQGL